MISANDDGRLDLSVGNQLVDGQAKFGALAVAQPADARRKALEADALAGQINPARQLAIFRKEFEDEIVGDGDVLGIARQGRPAEGTFALAKQGTNIRRHKAREVVRVFYSLLECECAYVVAIIEGDRAHLLQAQHAFHVARHGRHGLRLVGLGIAGTQRESFLEGHAVGHVAVQRVVRRGLVGENVRHHAALCQLGDDVGAVAYQPYADVLLLTQRVLQNAQGLVQRVDHEVAIAALQALLNALRVHVNAQERGAGHGGRQRLRSAHAAHATAYDELARQVSAKMFIGGGHERLKGSLDDALRADVNPTAGGHLAVGHQPGALQLVELLPVVPVAHQVAVTQQHARSVLMRAQNTHGLATLDEQRLVVLQ